MIPTLLLVDIQNDFLRVPGLRPAADEFVPDAVRLLEGCRAVNVPVVHIWTTVRREDGRRMPHWVRSDKWICVAGTDGHATPAALSPRSDEIVIHKIFFSAFHTGELARALAVTECDTVVIAGLYEHACVRTTAIDAYQAGFEVWIPTDAVASNDFVHAEITRRYMAERAARYESIESLLHMLHDRCDSRSTFASERPDPKLQNHARIHADKRQTGF
jgi:nicotinamidase-related amidase